MRSVKELPEQSGSSILFEERLSHGASVAASTDKASTENPTELSSG